MNEQEFAELSAGYALNALSAEDRRAFDATLAKHPEWSVHLESDLETVAFLAETTAPEVAPPALRDAILARVMDTPQDGHPDTASFTMDEDFAAAGPAPAAAPASSPKRNRARRGWFGLAASVALLVAIGLGTVVVAQQLNPPATVVALDRIESADDARSASVTLDDGGSATLHWSESVGEVVLVADGLPALPADRTFEAWFVRGDTPISAGTFDADRGETAAILRGEMREGDVIALTVEPDGGSPTGQPTTDPILAIATA